MGRIIRMPGDAHREVGDLLPWYVTGQLDPADLSEVESHLKHCPECRADVVFQQQLAREIPKLPVDVEHGWSRMRRRLDQERSPRGLAWLGDGFETLRQRVGRALRVQAAWPGWALVALLAVGGTALVLPVLAPARYHALGAARPAVAGNVVVIFRPDTPEKALRDTLRAHHARLVDGPTAADGYVLLVPAAERMQILARLRAQPDVVLAEAIDLPSVR
jgi:anti-sigma factor RsiW